MQRKTTKIEEILKVAFICMRILTATLEVAKIRSNQDVLQLVNG